MSNISANILPSTIRLYLVIIDPDTQYNGQEHLMLSLFSINLFRSAELEVTVAIIGMLLFDMMNCNLKPSTELENFFHYRRYGVKDCQVMLNPIKGGNELTINLIKILKLHPLEWAELCCNGHICVKQ